MLSSLILMSAFKISITIIMLCKNTGSYLLERVVSSIGLHGLIPSYSEAKAGHTYECA